MPTPIERGRKARRISHDKIFKTLFQHNLQDLVELFEHDVGPVLDFDTTEFGSGEAFEDLKTGGHVSLDLVARIGRRDAEPPVLLHGEIEARYRGDILPRMWKYFTLLSARNLDASVMSVVVYLKGGPRGVKEHVAATRIGSFVPVSFRYLSLGLSGCLAEEWLEKPQVLVGALAALMRSKIWDRVEQKLQCMRRVLAEVNLERQYILAQVVENYLKLNDEENARYRAALAQEKVMTPFPLTFAEALEEHETRGEARGIAVGEARGLAVGEARGFAVGEARGIAVGEAQAKRDAILRLLDLRFGGVPAVLREKLSAIAELGRLNQIFDRAVQAPSVAELEAVLG